MQDKSKENKQENKFVIGDIVTLKTHPLLYDFKIKGDGKLVPPFMIVKEIYIEDKKKKTHSEELGEQIAERIKYTCVFFDDNKTEFKEAILYESMLEKYDKIHIARLDKNKKEVKCDSLIDETRKYVIPEYNYGDIVFFRTKKFEIFKKRDSSKMIQQKGGDYKKTTNIQYIVNYSSPDFILCGIKKNENTNDFYPNGDKRRIVSEILYKVKWFNANQMKFSDIYLPRECFTDIQ
ncbi:hypothetical protein [Tenacibaculum finnmarkense]|uniref:hypothetical protein n=1 Tax=Tenacibaculum finnmarkense TaxID=2781243 RepID=UPI0013564271|nr:hypothetical protein [Tenacibaculum finnmarkense]MCD8438902.1 hypothetical protein [Tenacibaculum finnmarkense genomovar ulcerans]MCG8719826.1 hypothetical protein [Tenacibaculum finnmarkense]